MEDKPTALVLRGIKYSEFVFDDLSVAVRFLVKLDKWSVDKFSDSDAVVWDLADIDNGTTVRLYFTNPHAETLFLMSKNEDS